MEAKIFQNPHLEAAWGLLGRCWGFLGVSWAQDPKKASRYLFFGLQLASQNRQKVEKIDVKKSTCFETRFFLRISSILSGF